MNRWKNFRVWRARFPHWRADEQRYYVSFRHRRPLESAERKLLFQGLLKGEGGRVRFVIVGVFPETSEMVFTVPPSTNGAEAEFSKFIEACKRRIGKKIIENTGERFSPFYSESFDRILRDEDEFAERVEAICTLPVELELAEDHSEYETISFFEA
jgi:hypothetical protein